MGTEGELKLVRVTDMYLECMYPMVPHAIAVSDRCRRPANTTVEFSDKSVSWRCTEHRGMIKDDVTGPVSETMLTRQDVDESLVLDRPQV